MAKKKQRSTDEPIQLDMSKGFGNGAFSSLKSLKEMKKSDEDEARKREKQREEQERLKREKQMADIRDFRFTEADLNDDSSMSDAEIFYASMKQMDDKVDIYQSKFNVKEKPKPQTAKEKDDNEHLTMTDEEREFALFTQEMAISNVKRMAPPPKPVHKVRNKGKYLKTADELKDKELVSVDPAPDSQQPGMKTDFVAPQIAVTQIEKGDDIIEHPDISEAITASQKQLLHDVKRYESRYGMVITLKLRGMTLNAAMARTDDFIAACLRDSRPYALIICGKGLGSAGEPVIKNNIINMLRSDKRITEYAPVLNSDGDFGSVYVSFKRNQ